MYRSLDPAGLQALLDSAALRDFQAFARQTGNELLQHVEQDGVFSFLLRRR